MKMQLIGIRLTLAAAAITSLTLASGCCTKSTAEAYPAQGAAETPQETQVSPPQNMGTTIPLYKETLSVGTRPVDAGTVTVKKVVKTETVTQPVELRTEDVVIERQPASSAPSSPDMSQAFQEGQTVIHLTRDEPVIQKQTVPNGVAVIKKTSQTEQQNIQGQVRSEDVVTSREGQAQGSAESPSGQNSGNSNTQNPNGQ